MNTHTRRGLAAAIATLAGLASTVLGATAARAETAPTWKSERGIVVECAGHAHGVQVWTSVYENQRYGNTVQVVIGDPDAGHGSSRNTTEKFLVDGVLKASVKVDGKRALIEGTAERYGARTRIYDEYEDAGFLIKTRGFHRQLRTDLTAHYSGRSIPLTCDPSFFYDLEVKKIPIT